jgi:hypothetical protein
MRSSSIVGLMLLCVVATACKGDDENGDSAAAEADADADSDTDSDTDTDTVTANGVTASRDAEVESMVHVRWEQASESAAHVEYSFETDDGGKQIWVSSPTRTASAGTNERLLVGIPFATNVALRVVADDASEPIVGPTIETGPIPSSGGRTVPVPVLDTWDPAATWADGKYMITSINDTAGGWTGGTYWVIVFDRKGRLVWAKPTPSDNWTLFVTIDPITRDHFLWDESEYWRIYDDASDAKVHRSYLDADIETIATPGLHHTFVELPDGTLAWGSKAEKDVGKSYLDEALAELSPGDTESHVLWNSSDDWPGAGYAESNGLFYNTATDSFFYSFYTNNSVVEVDATTGESKWWAGDVEGGYHFEPMRSQFWWQHGITITGDGTLLLSTKTDASLEHDDTNGTSVREYEIDRVDEALHQVWHCDSGIYAQTNGDAARLPNGDTIHVIGTSSHIREYQPDCTVVWEIEFEYGSGDGYNIGRSELLADLYTLVSPQYRAE